MNRDARAVVALAMDLGARIVAPEVFREGCPMCGCSLHPLRLKPAREANGAKAKQGVVVDVAPGNYAVR